MIVVLQLYCIFITMSAFMDNQDYVGYPNKLKPYHGIRIGLREVGKKL